MYSKKPGTDSPLFAFDNVVATPHLGAWTEEAPVRASTFIAEQVAAVLRASSPATP